MMRQMKDDINEALQSLTISDTCKETILAKISVTPVKKHLSHSSLIAVLLACALSVGVMANTGMLERLIAHLGTSYKTSLLQPVTQNAPAIDQGIRMEGAAVLADSDSATIYLAVQDVEGDRLSEDFQFYTLEFPTASIGSVGWSYQVVGYDANTKTVYIELSMDNENLEGKTFTLSVKNFFSHENTLPEKILTTNLQELLSAPPQKSITAAQNQKYLAPGQLALPISDTLPVSLSAIGVLNGELHVQFQCSGRAPGQYNPYFSIEKEGSDAALQGYSVQYWTYDGSKEGRPVNPNEILLEDSIYYIELVCGAEDIQGILDAGLDQMQLTAGLHYYETFINGNWDIDVQIHEADYIVYKECNAALGPAQLTSFALSPMGITFKGHSEENILMENYPVVVHMKGGRQVSAFSSGGSFTQKNSTGETKLLLRYSFPQAMDIQDVLSIEIGGVLLPVQ